MGLYWMIGFQLCESLPETKNRPIDSSSDSCGTLVDIRKKGMVHFPVLRLQSKGIGDLETVQ